MILGYGFANYRMALLRSGPEMAPQRCDRMTWQMMASASSPQCPRCQRW